VAVTSLSTQSYRQEHGVRRVPHYIIAGGEFEHAWEKLATSGFKFVYHKKAARKLKIKYVCAGCEAAAWGKPDLHGECPRSKSCTRY
jgi:hypothetical protein